MLCGENCNCNIFHKDKITIVEKKLRPDNEYEIISAFFKVISSPTRVKLLDAIQINELCVCDLGHILGITKSAVSHQMKVLKELNLVESRKEGKMVYYSLKDKAIIDLIKKVGKGVQVI